MAPTREGEAPAEPLLPPGRARLPPSLCSDKGGRGSRRAFAPTREGEAPAEPQQPQLVNSASRSAAAKLQAREPPRAYAHTQGRSRSFSRSDPSPEHSCRGIEPRSKPPRPSPPRPCQLSATEAETTYACRARSLLPAGQSASRATLLQSPIPNPQSEFRNPFRQIEPPTLAQSVAET